MGEFGKDERELRALIALIKSNAGQGGSAEAEAAAKTSPPIPWNIPPKKKKNSIQGLLSRLRDPKPLSAGEEKRLENALKLDTAMNQIQNIGDERGRRTDEGALLGLRSQYPRF